MAYDGTTRLTQAVADLIGCSPKNNNKLAQVIGQAKNDLGIASKAKKLPTEINQQIYSHLVELYSQSINNKPVNIFSQSTNSDTVEIISQNIKPALAEPENIPQTPVELFSQDSTPKPTLENPQPSPVEIISQPDNNKPVEIYSQPNDNEPVNIVSHPNDNKAVELFSHTNNFDNVRIAFYIMRKGQRERQVISLDGFLINALLSIGISKQDVPQWLQAQVDDWTAFDGQLPITRQVKYLIIREVVKGLGGNDSVFYS